MPSIVNGLFSGRSGISSNGTAIAVVGDNISNSNTPGYKASRAEFADMIAGGQTAGKVVGSGSQNSAVSTIMAQGTLENTGRTLDLAIDGNGFFVVENPTGQKFYTRAGNFKLDTSGNIVDQSGNAVLGYTQGGSGALEPININTVSQSNISTDEVVITGNVDAGADMAPMTMAAFDAANPVSLAGSAGPYSNTSYAALNTQAAFSTVVDVFDSLGQSHTVNLFFFHTATNTYQVRAYVDSDDVDTSGTAAGVPRQITIAGGTVGTGTVTMSFDASGARTGVTNPDITFVTPWNNGSNAAKTVALNMNDFTQYSSASNVGSISQDGQGIGTVSSLVIDPEGNITAKLTNGQTADIGTLGMVNFSNPEGLTRIGSNLLQQSPYSGEPLIGRAKTGTFGAIASGSLELSTVDIATEFVKLITLEKGYQANSRIITTINQLLQEIIQLA